MFRVILDIGDKVGAEMCIRDRASAFGRIKIMVPLVTGVDELRSVKAMVADIMRCV